MSNCFLWGQEAVLSSIKNSHENSLYDRHLNRFAGYYRMERELLVMEQVDKNIVSSKRELVYTFENGLNALEWNKVKLSQPPFRLAALLSEMITREILQPITPTQTPHQIPVHRSPQISLASPKPCPSITILCRNDDNTLHHHPILGSLPLCPLRPMSVC